MPKHTNTRKQNEQACDDAASMFEGCARTWLTTTYTSNSHAMKCLRKCGASNTRRSLPTSVDNWKLRPCAGFV